MIERRDIGGATLYRGDCMEILPSIETGSVDAVMVDLPYGATQNHWDSILPLPELWEQYLRIAKPTAAFVFTASQPFSSALVMSQPKLFRHEWIWIKNAGSNFANTGREPFKEHESVLVFSRGKWTYNRQMQERAESGKSRVKTPVRFDTDSDNYGLFDGVAAQKMPELRVPSSWQRFNRERGLHPTQKPVALMEYLIRTYTNPGELVMDSCMGSGTTGLAALREGRRFVGMESDEGYFEIACRRLEGRGVLSPAA